MQERTSPAFVIATANDVRSLPPELLRKGRFDEVWWVDLPTEIEREQVLAATLRSYGRGKVEINLTAVAEVTDGFTGAEIAALVPDAMFSAFEETREIDTPDLLTAARSVVPLSKTAGEKIRELREWAAGRARPASRPASQTNQPSSKKLRAIDM